MENDAEHSWHLAMFLVVFEKELNDLDMKKMLKMALIHDLVEIYAGDTFAFDKEAKKDQKERELVAAKKLCGQLPDGHELLALFEEYEAKETKESQIVKAFDKIQAACMNTYNDGKVWKDHNLTVEDIDGYHNKPTQVHPLTKEIYTLLKEEIDAIMK